MRLPFVLDPQIIHHIIYSQAGSIGKAIIELIMNSVDAGATKTVVSITQAGFSCSDNGAGFASRNDVLSYFGKFGTPHVEGDATFGRFRLGRGQIMAFAKTDWASNLWTMAVDTLEMGYHYDLEETDVALPGCYIEGTWYDPLSMQEAMSAIQEIRDLVRYTPIEVEMNGKIITKNPANEQWTHEDEYAYYRVKSEGGMAIFNQGVLVRNESGQRWGAGGIIVSKNAIALNVSRTEVLRKTCPIWKNIETKQKKLVSEHLASMGKHRKTEASREHAVTAMLEGADNSMELYCNEGVITTLPGKKHISLLEFFQRCFRKYQYKLSNGQFTIPDHHEVPHGEMIAREHIINVIHPETLHRFGCENAFELIECFERINSFVSNQASKIPADPYNYNASISKHIYKMSYFDFGTLKAAHVEKTKVVMDTKALDKETKRAWTALKHCLHCYTKSCVQQFSSDRDREFTILLGQSNVAEAWTDGETYIAINIDVVKRMRTDPLKTMNYIFSLIEHEIAHEGDSLECGHDNLFYQRFHDININMASERQRFMSLWLRKYTGSLENPERMKRNKAWREKYLLERAGKGRAEKNLSDISDDEDDSEHMSFLAPPPTESFIKSINDQLIKNGHSKDDPDYLQLKKDSEELIKKGKKRAEAEKEERREWLKANADRIADEERAEQEYYEEMEKEYAAEMQAMYNHLESFCVEKLNITAEESIPLINFLIPLGFAPKNLGKIWSDKPWEMSYKESSRYSRDLYYEEEGYSTLDDDADRQPTWREEYELNRNMEFDVALDNMHLVKEGETKWSLERNAELLGMYGNDQYLLWRAEQEAD
jgi:hypothetical protein